MEGTEQAAASSEGRYWFGNAAKARIVDTLVAQAHERGRLVVFDHGCGDAGDWPQVLAEHPELALIAWDPDAARAAIARARLAGRRAQVLTPEEVAAAPFTADVVVSFSVLEHVRDRAAYLATVRRVLAPDGTFYLNYDDGHFRIAFDLDDWRAWPGLVRLAGRNLLARLGWPRGYQRRVARAEADRLVRAAGFRCEAVRYENLTALKTLARRIAPAERVAFARFWRAVEARLQAFAGDGPVIRGDTDVLWRVMASRTLVLRRDDWA